MKLTLKPSKKNSFAIGAVLIADPSPKVWLREMQQMNLPLHTVEAFAIPSDKANVLYGCLVVLGNHKVEAIGKNQYLQCIDSKVFIPEYAAVYPLVDASEWEMLLPETAYVYLPQVGLYPLNEPINWLDLMLIEAPKTSTIKAPGNTVFIPNSIKSYRIEYDEEALLKEMEEPFSEEAYIEKLPFDMKKLLNGNQREMEKYLAFMEKYPEKAMKYAIPLDTLGSSRGNNNGIFSFGGGSFFSNFFGERGLGMSGIESFIRSKAVAVFLMILYSLLMITFVFSPGPAASHNANGATYEPGSNPEKSASAKTKAEYQKAAPVVTVNKVFLVIFLITMGVILIKLAFESNIATSGYSNTRPVFFLILLLMYSLYILLSPIYYNEGFDHFFTIAILIIVGLVLYRVFNASKTLIKKGYND